MSIRPGCTWPATDTVPLTRSILWEAGLAGRHEVTVRVHPADDHLFFPGTGASTPADYHRPQHVDPAVIADLADWLGVETARPTLRERVADLRNRLRGSGARASISG